jgi:hypothetical protein
MGLLAWILRTSGSTHGAPPHSFSSSLLDVLSKVPNLIRARAEILDHQLQRIFTASRCRCRNIGNVSKGESFKYILQMQMHFLASNNSTKYEAVTP